MRFDVTDLGIAGARKLSQLDFVANNIANASTPGFKAEHLYYAMNGKKAQEGAMMELGPTVSRKDLAQGTLTATGGSLHAGIEGDGYFTIETKTGKAYTRNGSFRINNKNELVTSKGDYVQGENSKIVITGSKIMIDKDGSIYADDVLVGKLQIATFKDPHALSRSTDGCFVDDGKAGCQKAQDYKIAGGHLENSNVNTVREMTDMMDIQRTFETYQKMILTLSDMDKISTSRIGKLI